MITTNHSYDLEKLIAREIQGLGFELFGLEFDNHVSPKILRIYVELANKNNIECTVKEQELSRNSISVEDCGKINYHLHKVLSALTKLNFNNYVLEVSSPGLERRLFNLIHMEQCIGQEVKLRLKVPLEELDNRSNFVGILRSVDQASNQIVVTVDGQDLNFNFENIAKANLVYRKW